MPLRSAIHQPKRESTYRNLKWLHKIEVLQCNVLGKRMQYEVEDFGDYYDGNDEVFSDIQHFLSLHGSHNLDMQNFFKTDIIQPIRFTLSCGVQDIAKDEEINKQRKKKLFFIINQVIPRIFHHENFVELKETISLELTNLLVLIAELAKVHRRHEEEYVEELSSFFKAKDFLAEVALQIWSVCFYEQRIPMVANRTLPCLRKLAIMDVIDSFWNYAGSWGKILNLLEKRHAELPRISTDKALDDSTEILRAARNSVRCQVLELGALESAVSAKVLKAPQMFRYYPKCSAYLCQHIETADKPHRLRCYSCHYYHWCSAACQQYSEEVAGHHEQFCSICPEYKKDEIRAEMEDYLNIASISQDDDKLTCHACGLSETPSQQLHRCSKCKVVHYCSKECQLWDWHHGNHRSKCERSIFD